VFVLQSVQFNNSPQLKLNVILYVEQEHTEDVEVTVGVIVLVGVRVLVGVTVGVMVFVGVRVLVGVMVGVGVIVVPVLQSIHLKSTYDI